MRHDFPISIAQPGGTKMLIRRFEFDDSECLDEPIGIERNVRPHRRGRILIVSAVPHFSRISSHPEPKEGVVAAEVEFLSGHTGGGALNSQPLGTFKCQSGVERKQNAWYSN